MSRFSQKGSQRSAQSGQAIVLIAFAMIGIMAFMVLAIDGGKYFDTRRSAQNAADMSSLSGIWTYNYAPSSKNDQKVLISITEIAEANGIQDPDGVPTPNDVASTPTGGTFNSNIHAYWITSAGDYICSSGTTQLYTIEPPLACAEIVNDTSLTEPTGASGTRVRVTIPYTTFVGGLIGQHNLTGQADSTAVLRLSTTPTTDDQSSAWLGGGDCDNLYDKIAFNWVDTKNVQFRDSVYVDGSFMLGVAHDVKPGESTGNTNFYGNFEVRLIAGDHTSLTPSTSTNVDGSAVSPYNAKPAFNTGDGWNNGAAYFAPTGNYQTGNPPVASSRGFPDWAYEPVTNGLLDPNGVKTQVVASSFDPNGGNAAFMYNTYAAFTGGFFVDSSNSYRITTTPTSIAAPAASTLFVSVNPTSNDTTLSPRNGLHTATDSDINTAQGTNAQIPRIIYVNGNLVLSGNNGGTNANVSIIVKGLFLTTSNHVQLGYAGIAANNISLLAGWDYGMPNRCASDASKAVVENQANEFHWPGVLYAPFGQTTWDGNYSVGAPNTNGPIIGYSMNLGGNGGDNNQQFAMNQSLMQQVDASTLIVH